MGNKSTKQQRYDNASKTGVFALQIPNLRMLTIENCSLSKLPPDIAKTAVETVCVQIDLSQNVLEDLPEPMFAGMSKLKEATFANNLLTAFPASIAGAASLKVLDLSNNRDTEGGVPAGLLRDTPLEIIKLQGNPLSSVDGEEGAEEYLARSKKHTLKNIDQKVKTGDLSSGLGTPEEYAALRKG